jgi:hypothetical protein
LKELGHRGRRGALASLEAQGFTGEGGTASASTDSEQRTIFDVTTTFRVAVAC